MGSNIHGAFYSQVSLLNTLFPGLSIVWRYIHPLTSGNAPFSAQILCIYGLAVFLTKFGSKRIKEIVEKYFTFTFTVSRQDESYDILYHWIKAQPFATEARSTVVTLERESGPPAPSGATKKVLQYMPWNSRKYFWHKGKLLCVRLTEDRSWTEQSLSISCFGTSSKALKDFLYDCKDAYEMQKQGKTAIYMNGDGWTLVKRRSQRRVDTIVLPENVKADFLNDVAEYLDPNARAWYAERDLPYRRGYLLHGQPGTGKSSLSFAAAGHFDLDVYVLNLAKVSDSTLQRLMAKLPARCIVLLEDIDAIESAKSREAVGSEGKPAADSVTLSGLLNALDGVASEEGRVLIMTTNHVDRIDRAIIRPGRVDKMIEFGFANRQTLLGLFQFIYTPLPGKAKETGAKRGADAVQQLAKVFADHVPEMKFSPAEILSFLTQHKQSPQSAVDNIKSWLERKGEGCVPLRSQTSTMTVASDEIVYVGIDSLLSDADSWTSWTR